MYKSPIELITSETMRTIAKSQEEQVMRAVMGVGVNVDKDELLKALAYDRQQYDKGFEDGVKSFAKYLVDVSDTGFISVVDLVDYAANMLGEGECEDG